MELEAKEDTKDKDGKGVKKEGTALGNPDVMWKGLMEKAEKEGQRNLQKAAQVLHILQCHAAL